MRDEVLASQAEDWRDGSRVAMCRGAAAKPVFYQKHMTHHMLKGCGSHWIWASPTPSSSARRNDVLTSYTKKWSDVTLRDIGFVEQAEIFDMVAQHLARAPWSTRTTS